MNRIIIIDDCSYCPFLIEGYSEYFCKKVNKFLSEKQAGLKDIPQNCPLKTTDQEATK